MTVHTVMGEVKLNHQSKKHKQYTVVSAVKCAWMACKWACQTSNGSKNDGTFPPVNDQRKKRSRHHCCNQPFKTNEKQSKQIQTTHLRDRLVTLAKDVQTALAILGCDRKRRHLSHHRTSKRASKHNKMMQSTIQNKIKTKYINAPLYPNDRVNETDPTD